MRSNRFEENTLGAIASYDLAQSARDHGLPAATIERLRRLPRARYLVAYDRFRKNKGATGAAINVDLSRGLQMTVTGGLFADNAATGAGGAIAVTGGTMVISHSLFRGNRSNGLGPAIRFIDGVQARLDLSNSLIVENVGPGAAVDADAATLTNVTIASNQAVGLRTRGIASVSNSIISANKPANCAGIAAQAFKGGNLQFGAADCPGVAVGDPYLDALYVPAPGSAALMLGDAAICRAIPVSGSDLLFQERHNSVCALGAFERPPLRSVKQRPLERIRAQRQEKKQ